MIVIQLFLFFVVFSTSVGLFNIGPLFHVNSPIGDFNAKDILFIMLIVTTIPGYIRRREKLANIRWFNIIELCWILFIIFLAIQAYRSPADNLSARLNNVRIVQGYLFFFPAISLISTNKRYKLVDNVFRVIALLGAFLVIAQTLRGSTLLFDSPFYMIYASGIKETVGRFTRVMASIAVFITFILLNSLNSLIIKFKYKEVAVSLILTLATIISFSRNLWIATFAGLLVGTFLLKTFGILKGTKTIKLIVFAFVIILLTLVSLLIGSDGLIQAIITRLGNGLTIFQNNTGTWASRMVAQEMALNVWKHNMLWGIGTNYLPVVGLYIDLGIPLALVSVGTLGLVLILLFFMIIFLLGVSTLRSGVKLRSTPMILLGCLVCETVILTVVYQQFIDPQSFAIIGVISAVACCFCGEHQLIKKAQGVL